MGANIQRGGTLSSSGSVWVLSSGAFY